MEKIRKIHVNQNLIAMVFDIFLLPDAKYKSQAHLVIWQMCRQMITVRSAGQGDHRCQFSVLLCQHPVLKIKSDAHYHTTAAIATVFQDVICSSSIPLINVQYAVAVETINISTDDHSNLRVKLVEISPWFHCKIVDKRDDMIFIRWLDRSAFRILLHSKLKQTL